MINLNLNQYVSKLQIKEEEGTKIVFDPIRRKWIILQPEELVRQLLLYYFINILNYPEKRIQVEKGILLPKQQSRRFDIVIYNQEAHPAMLVECKSYTQKITQAAFDQIGNYNRVLQVRYLVITNGLQTFVSELNYENSSLDFIKEFPNKATFSS